MSNKKQALLDLLAAMEEDEKAIDDKNVDTAELEALIERQKNEYLAARDAAYQRIRARLSAGH